MKEIAQGLIRKHWIWCRVLLLESPNNTRGLMNPIRGQRSKVKGGESDIEWRRRWTVKR